MKIGACTVSHFGSYESLTFDFQDQGLALIHGATGSGKSTFQDVVVWVLFGCTAKDGAVDEVRSWTSGSEPTTGTLEVSTPGGEMTVTRIRGANSQNDLYWSEGGDSEKFRGKDITETQVLLEKRLGVSKSLYLCAAYFSEFNPAAKFFSASAKERRAIFEDLVDMTFPVTIAEGAAAKKRDAKATHRIAELEWAKAEQELTSSIRHLESTSISHSNWDREAKTRVQALASKIQNFEKEKVSKINALETRVQAWEQQRDVKVGKLLDRLEFAQNRHVEVTSAPCPTCGRGGIGTVEDSQTVVDQLIESINDLRDSENPHHAPLEDAKQWQGAEPSSLEALLDEKNPFSNTLLKATDAVTQAKASRNKSFQSCKTYATEISTYEQLADLALDLRTNKLVNAVSQIETRTNKALEIHFDAEIRIGIKPVAGDKLDVTIHRNGHECAYTQLSKGQRQLLRLCFVVSIMQGASEQAGVHFDALFFDESLDGLDSEFKLKAYTLFQALATQHPSVFVIDHATELKSLFNKQYQVTLEGDHSVIEEQYA